MASLNTKVDKLDIDKLVSVPVDLSKLSDVVKNDVIKRTEYDKLVATVNIIDASGFVLKTKHDTDKSESENKVPDISGLVKKTDYDVKIWKIKDKTPNATNLGTKTALTTIENKYLMLVVLLKKQIVTLKLQKLKKNLIIIIMINILLLHSLIL